MDTHEIPIQQLFDLYRFKEDWDEPGFIIYLPFGLVLLVLRLLLSLLVFPFVLLFNSLGLQASPELRKKLFWGILGLKVKVENESLLKRSARVILANHVTYQDHVALDLVIKCIEPKKEMPPWFVKFLFGCHLCLSECHDRDFHQYIKTLADGSPLPVLVFPEETTTNGRVGLLKMVKCPAVSGLNVQPISIRIRGPFYDQVSLNTISGSWWSDLLWMMFLPWTVYQIRFLRSLKLQEDEDVEQFTQRVADALSQDLELPLTSHTIRSKSLLMGRRAHQTNIIDLTISNSNQGTLISNQKTPTSSPDNKNNTLTAPKLVVSNKPRNQMSFAERKQLMISEAREKYLAKHAKKLITN